jgi:NAD(P)-dependent dehydrogenase (short-subunit alcohol dehydrogenase family)
MSKSVILVTGASSGFGLMTAKSLAQAGHTVFASMREAKGRNPPQVTAIARWAALDVIVHNAGHMVFGPAEAFTPEQLSQQYKSTSSARSGSTVPRCPICAVSAKASWSGSAPPRRAAARRLSLRPISRPKRRMDAPAVSYSTELALWGIETTIMVPGAFTRGTNHFAHSGKPSDQARVAEYESGPYAGIADKALKGLAGLEPADADPSEVARQIVRVVDLPFGERPFRVHVDPSQDGAEIVNGVADRMRREMYRNIGLEDLLHPAITV